MSAATIYVVRPTISYSQPGHRAALAAADYINATLCAQGRTLERHWAEAEIASCDPSIAANLTIEAEEVESEE